MKGFDAFLCYSKEVGVGVLVTEGLTLPAFKNFPVHGLNVFLFCF